MRETQRLNIQRSADAVAIGTGPGVEREFRESREFAGRHRPARSGGRAP